MAIITSQIAAELHGRATINGKLSAPATIDGDVQVVDHIYERDHNNLINRNLENQHPISAISGLEEALLEKANVSDLARVAFSGLLEDLIQEQLVIIDCGTATENI